MKKLTPYVRVVLIFGLIFFFVEYFIDSEKPAFIEFPLVALFLSLILFVLIAIEVTYGAIENIVYQLLDEKQKEEFLKERSFTDSHSSYKKWMRWLTKSKPVEQNEEILREHDFDGIQELDNALPPWWLYGFYFTIIFAVVYLVRFHVLGGDNQIQEFDKALTEANAAVQEYKKNNPDLMDASNVALLTEAADLEKGKAIFQANCIPCHAPDGGGGIGPNLTDNHWILGPGISRIYTTISEGGRSGKGMIPWKTTLKPIEMQQVASYVISLKGTTPANPKEAEGDIIEE
ncbi:MAG: cytochrome C oxidase subunit III [Flavobacteriales bacterium CG_4_9_14_3_um_filter_40_17]|nr:MAG: cytochrome C oxidase subunit III [Flavobacteriales bacterium CG_4_9_14_3_um_filter_40_17]